MDAARERRRRGPAGRRLRPRRERPTGSRRRATPTRPSTSGVKGAELVGLAVRGAVRHAARRARMSSTGSSRGTTSRWTRAPASSTSRPAAAREDFELAREHGLPVLTPVDESGRFYADYGWLHGLSTVEVADQIVGDLEERGLLVEAGTVTPPLPGVLALPHAADLPDLRRLVHLRGRRSASRCCEANGEVEWTPAYMGKRMDDWLAQHGRLEHLATPLLRPAAAVLPVRLRPPERDRLAGGARAARRGRARPARRAAPAVDRRGADPLRACGEEVARIPEVGDVWLDAGIVPFSTLGWQNPEWVPEGYAPAPPRGSPRRPARPRVLGAVVPGRLGLGDARADPPLVLLPALHVGRADGRAPFTAGARLREAARRARPRDARLVGQHDRGRGRVRAHGRRRDALAVLRAAAEPEPPLRLRARRSEIKRKLLTLWNSVRFLVDYGEHRGLPAALDDLEAGPADGELRPLDRWLVSRARSQLVAEATEALRGLPDGSRDRRLRALPRRPVQLVHPALPAPVLGGRRGGALARCGTRSCRRCAWSRR